MFGALTARLWFMQVLAAQQYRRQEVQNGVRVVQESAPRGRIFDRNGDLLVGNRASLTVMVDRDKIGTHQEEVLFRLSKLLRLPVKQLVRRINDKRYFVYTPVPVKSDIPKDVAFQIAEHQQQYPGVSTALLPVRTYTYGNLAAQLLGYTGEITQQQLDSPQFRTYSQGDLVGQSGIEATYEHWLQGRKGEEKFRVNSAGKNLGPIGSAKQPRPGDDVVLSIDARTQHLAERSLALGEQAARSQFDTTTGIHYRADAGAVVVEDPKNGQILAMASNPTYDPRLSTNGFSTQEWKSLTNPARHYPLFNRTIQAQYPPGSTFKPFVALAALHHGIASQVGSYNCPSSFQVPGDTSGTVFQNWSPVNSGYISLAQALNISCDTVFYQFGYQFWVDYARSGAGTSNSALGDWHGRNNFLQSDLRRFGFGGPTGVDIPFEQGGRIPDGQWKDHAHRQDPKLFPYPLWLPGDSINMSIGQGDTLVTPLQLATAYSAIANGGTVYVPHVADQVELPNGHVAHRVKPVVAGRLPFTKSDLQYVRNALTNVPQTGTGAVAFRGFPFSRVPVAAKTGSAEVKPFQTYSWFAAMAPAYDPQYVIVCIVEQGGHGSTTAAPVVRRILEKLFHLPSTQFSLGNVAD
jgi:penicillin-binding protein 2